MTRINSAIPVRCLTDEHLLAEHREIKRLPYCLNKWNRKRRVPEKFTLGRGHVIFFFDKMKFIYESYLEVRDECIRRGFDVEDYSRNWSEFIISEYWNDYEPGCEEKVLLTERITQKISESPKKVWHLSGRPINKDEAIKLLQNL